MTFGVWCSAEHENGKRGTNQIILRMTFSVWHDGRKKFVRAWQWDTRTTQKHMEKNAGKRLAEFVKSAEKHLKKRGQQFTEERYEWGVHCRAEARRLIAESQARRANAV
jgi:hypothetical protein